MRTVFIIPTGIGCNYGGHAGDATPALKLIAEVSDIVYTHPNVVNASDINEMPINCMYVEGNLLDGIKLAWTVSVGRKVFANSVTKHAMFGFSIVVIAILLGKTFIGGSQYLVTKNVSAKTVSESVGELVDATMSAVFRK